MNKKSKIWGFTQSLFCKNNVEIHRAEIKKGQRCSKHKHEHKQNAFFIEKGKLKIHIWNENEISEAILISGEMSVVKSNMFHMFEALENTIMYEIYWVELSEDDIIREKT